MIEREVKLAAPPGFRLLDLGAVADDVVVSAGEERTLLSTYVDTADLRLARWGCTLRHRAGEGWTLKLPDAGDGEVLERPEITVDAPAGTPPEALVDLVRAYVRSAPLREVARMRTVRRSLMLMSHDGRRLAEIDDDEVSVLENRRVAARFREVEVEAADGAPDALIAAVVARLRAVGAGRPDPTPKLHRVLGDRVRVAEVCVGDLDRTASAGDVARRAIAASVLRLLTHDGGVRLGGDPEDVHQARVATRRLRSDLRTFAPLLDPVWAEGLRDRLAEVAADLGAVRDAEVLRDRLAATASHLPSMERARAAPVLRALDTAADDSREVLLSVMRTPTYVDLLDDLVVAAREPAFTADASRKADEVLPGLVRAPWSRLRKARRRLSRPPTDTELHALRIRAKRARYAAEAVAPVLGRRAERAARAAAALQGELGELHDAVVAADWLRAHGRGRHAFATGALLGLETAAAERARVRWRAAWRKIARMDTTTWM